MSRSEIFLIAFIVVLFSSMAYAIIATASAHEPEVYISEPWTPPEIEQCDLPLWDRIRYLCPEEEANE